MYNISRYTLIDFFDGERLVSLKDSLEDKQILYAAQPNRWAGRARTNNPWHLASDTALHQQNSLYDPPFIQFFDRKLVLLKDNHLIIKGKAPPVGIDILIFKKSPRQYRRLPAILSFPISGVRRFEQLKQTDRWKAECEAADIPYYDVREQGAWVYAK